jgi:hypothetical protein
VTRRDGVVVACVWDHAGDKGPLAAFWSAARALDPSVEGEATLAGTREGHLAELFAEAGLRDVQSTVLAADLEHPTFDSWWEPFTGGVGPAGAYVASLPPERRAALSERCRAALGTGPITIIARAWAARGVVSSRGSASSQQPAPGAAPGPRGSPRSAGIPGRR